MADNVNRLKNDLSESAEKKAKSARTPQTAVPKREKDRTLVPSFLKSEGFIRVSALFLMISSLFLAFAFVSHLFHWEADYDKVKDAPFTDLLVSTDVIVGNAMGKFGAYFAYVFFHLWFGIASFVIPLNIFILGFKLFFGITLLPLRKTFLFSLFGAIFVSLAMSFIFTDDQQILGGSFGYHLYTYLHSVIGNVGVGFLLLFSALSFGIINFNWKLNLPDRFTQAREDKPVQEKSGNTVLPLIPDDEEELNDEEEDEEDEEVEEEEEVYDDITENELDIDEEEHSIIDLNLPGSVKPIVVNPVSGIEFTIAETAEDEIIEVIDGGLTEEDKDRMNLSEILSENEEFDLGEYDPTLDLADYKYPTFDLLDNHGSNKVKIDKSELEANSNRIIETLKNYSIEIAKISASVGPTVTLYEIVPAPGVRISKIKNLEDDIALSLSALGIRIIAPMPGKGTIGIEVPNQNPEIVAMKVLLQSEKFLNTTMDLPIALGKTISNENFVADLAKMPHLLMAGATGQGKSVGLNAILVSLLYKKHPSEIKFVLVDPKKVELTLFNKIERHFLAKLPGNEDAIITDTKKVVHTLNSLCILMDERYELLKIAMVRNIKEYNVKFKNRKLNPNNGHHFMPYIVLVVDEFADLIMTAGKEVELPIARLAQLARAIGIHLIIATQRPSVNIITGTIKANFPARIAFRVTSKIDSRTILDSGGADQLIGRGDMLFSTGSDLIRLQCPFVDTPEVDKITEFIGSQRAYPSAFELPEYIDENGEGLEMEDDAGERDAMFDKAAHIIVSHQQGSASLLQRKLKLGYNRAGRIVDQLEKAGIIGPFEGSKARKVLIKDALSLEQFLNSGENT
jgi:S-DNA-T family DNA segregation ATPase FtsK/SpoIIIE